MRAHFRQAFLALPLALAALAGGCAPSPDSSDPDAVEEFKATNDPLEPLNRAVYEVTDGVDAVIVRPIALAYRNIVPNPVRRGVRNVLNNAASPVVLANDMMQGKPKRAGDTFVRFIVNTTVGIGGIFDVATGMGYPYHDTDFGTTLAVWGWDENEGPYLFLPLFGPSNPRDAIGVGVDFALNPLTWTQAGTLVEALEYTKTGVDVMDTRSLFLDSFDKVKAQALDPYATVRSLSRQNRKATIEEVIADDRGTAAAARREREAAAAKAAGTAPAP
jgi:phospholipid-binding lipoprotein MlaA